MKRLTVAIALTSAIASSCRDKAPEPAAPPPSAAATVPRASTTGSTLRDPRRFDCTTDADCTNSCRWGAVNAKWYAGAEKQPDFEECKDGCANQVTAPARCEAGGCVAYETDPRDQTKVSKRPHCTRVER